MNVMTWLDSGFSDHLSRPIHIRMSQRTAVCAEFLQVIGLEGEHIFSHSVMCLRLIILRSPLITVGKIRHTWRHLKANWRCKTDAGPIFCATLCCDKDNAISTSNTEYCRGRSIFQHRHILHFIRVNLWERTLYSVNKDKRLRQRSAQRTDTTDEQLRTISSRLTARLNTRQAGNLSNQRVAHARNRRFRQFITIDWRQSTCHRDLSCGAIGNDLHII